MLKRWRRYRRLQELRRVRAELRGAQLAVALLKPLAEESWGRFGSALRDRQGRVVALRQRATELCVLLEELPVAKVVADDARGSQ